MNKTDFDVIVINARYADELCRKIAERFGVKTMHNPMNTGVTASFSLPRELAVVVIKNEKLGINRFAEIRAYAEGYKACLY